MVEEYRNENEIMFFTPGRSGSHAIVNWIASMYKEPVYFFNNCPFRDPYRAPFPYYFRVRNTKMKKFFVFVPKLRLLTKTEIDQYRNIHKNCLMYGYEHKNITKLKNGMFIEDHDTMLGKSKNRYSVLILRDYFNWLASSLVQKRVLSQPLSLYPKYNVLGEKNWAEYASVISAKHYVESKLQSTYWKYCAEEFLGRTSYLKEKKVCISFNQWFTNEDYRIKVAGLLDLEYSDFTINYAGSPSSFDYRDYKKRAQEIKALDRWKTLKDNVVYREVLNQHLEAQDLSYEIFGREIGAM